MHKCFIEEVNKTIMKQLSSDFLLSLADTKNIGTLLCSNNTNNTHN